jgi:chromosomal replication initiation ATPase DnaA
MINLETPRRLFPWISSTASTARWLRSGQELGGRDAAAVSNACKSIGGSLDSNPYLKRKIEDIKQTINNLHNKRP